MPELPEVETMRRGVLGVVGATIADVKRPPCTKKPISITPAMGTFRRKLLGKQKDPPDRSKGRLQKQHQTSS